MLKKNISYNVTLLAAFILVSLVSILVIGWQGYHNGKLSLEALSLSKLTAVREMKKRQVESYFQQIRNQCLTFSEDDMVINAMKEFKTAFYKVADEVTLTTSQEDDYKKILTTYYTNEFLRRTNALVEKKRTIEEYFPTKPNSLILQYAFIANNPNPTGEKDNLNTAEHTGTYGTIHAHYHPILRNFLKKFKYYDIFLIDHETGFVVYTVFKEIDFANNLFDSNLKNSNLTSLVRDLAAAPSAEIAKLIHFAPYDPSYTAPASFIGTTIFDGDKKIGILAFQVPIDQINDYMTDGKRWREIGLGKTGETYLVGEDHKMLSLSRFFIENKEQYLEVLEKQKIDPYTIDKMKAFNTTILLQNVDTKPARNALKGEEGVMINNDYRNVEVLSAYGPLKIQDVDWCIIAQMDRQEAFSLIYKLARIITLWSLFILFFVLFFTYMFIKFFISPQQKGSATILETILNQFDNLPKLIDQYAQGVNQLIAQEHIKSRLLETLNTSTTTLTTEFSTIQNSQKQMLDTHRKVSFIFQQISAKALYLKEQLSSLSIKGTEKEQIIGQLQEHINYIKTLHLEFISLSQSMASFIQMIKEKSFYQQLVQHIEQLDIDLQALSHEKDMITGIAQQLSSVKKIDDSMIVSVKEHLQKLDLTMHSSTATKQKIERAIALFHQELMGYEQSMPLMHEHLKKQIDALSIFTTRLLSFLQSRNLSTEHNKELIEDSDNNVKTLLSLLQEAQATYSVIEQQYHDITLAHEKLQQPLNAIKMALNEMNVSVQEKGALEKELKEVKEKIVALIQACKTALNSFTVI